MTDREWSEYQKTMAKGQGAQLALSLATLSHLGSDARQRAESDSRRSEYEGRMEAQGMAALEAAQDQAEEAAEARQLQLEANNQQQKFQFAQWRQTEHGQAYERWRENAYLLKSVLSTREDTWASAKELDRPFLEGELESYKAKRVFIRSQNPLPTKPQEPIGPVEDKYLNGLTTMAVGVGIVILLVVFIVVVFVWSTVEFFINPDRIARVYGTAYWVIFGVALVVFVYGAFWQIVLHFQKRRAGRLYDIAESSYTKELANYRQAENGLEQLTIAEIGPWPVPIERMSWMADPADAKKIIDYIHKFEEYAFMNYPDPKELHVFGIPRERRIEGLPDGGLMVETLISFRSK